MKPRSSVGCPDIDGALAAFPDVLVESIGPYEQRVSYKCWKVPGRKLNWLQWNDGGTPRLPIEFDNSRGQIRTWKLFARFAIEPRGPWDKPSEYGDHKWMPAGDDVWGCSCEALRGYLNRIQELEELLRVDFERSYSESIQRYG